MARSLRNYLFVVLLAGFFSNSCLLAAEIALSFDDAPRSDGKQFSGQERTRRLIGGLDAAGVEGAIFFSTAGHIDDAGRRRLLRYTEAGHYIANHSFSHTHPHRMGVEAYMEDMQRADSVLRNFENFLPLYRFPFLDEGRDETTRDLLRKALADMGYQNGYVTVDNYDWYMDHLLQKSLEQGKEVDFEALGEAYVELMMAAVNFYQQIAIRNLGRSPKHVLLLHENDLAALYIGDLVKELRRQGWTIIPGPEAYTDPIADDIPNTLFNNQGRVAAIAATQGQARAELVHEAEDEAWLEKYFAQQGVFGETKDGTPPKTAAAPSSGY